MIKLYSNLQEQKAKVLTHKYTRTIFQEKPKVFSLPSMHNRNLNKKQDNKAALLLQTHYNHPSNKASFYNKLIFLVS